MKKVSFNLVVVIFIFIFVGFATLGLDTVASGESQPAKITSGPIIAAATPMVKMNKDAKVVIMGAGFNPGQEIFLMFTSSDGVRSDIGYALKPKPMSSERGTWATTWSCGRYIQKKFIKEGAYTITATDGDYNTLVHAPVYFWAEK